MSQMILCSVCAYKRVERIQVGEQKRRRAGSDWRVCQRCLLSWAEMKRVTPFRRVILCPAVAHEPGQRRGKWGSAAVGEALTRLRSRNETRRGCESQPGTTALTMTAAMPPA